MSHKKRLGTNSSENGDYLQACLEVDPLNWTFDENTPRDAENEGQDEATQSKQRKTEDRKDVALEQQDVFPADVSILETFLPVPCVSKTVQATSNELKKQLLGADNKTGGIIIIDDPFSFLVDEIILSIFKLLPHSSLTRCVQVCHRWKQLGYDDLLWREVNLDGKHINCAGVLGSILHRGVRVVRLSKAEILAPICVNDCNVSSENSLFSCGTFSLTHLDASMTKFGADNLACLLFRCNSLKFLSLEGCKMGIREITAISYNHGLEVLNLALSIGLTSSAIDVVTRKCLKLKSLNLSWTNQTRDSVRYICRCKELQELNLSGLRGGINRKVMEMLVTSCSKLTALDFSDVTLQIGTMKLVADNCAFLQKLSISRCSDVKPEQLLELLKLPELSHLNLFGFVNSDALDRFTKARPGLYINKGVFSPIARPISTATYEGRLWEQYSGFII
ncbi:S-phase kinase-associated protein 2-like isoform X1 [Hydractinia symbiolongicarpus]|uniref:S-phase kinase-associated protein 2-like isoform X1 n=1 Tax=Hydractinia symbiolongicarpus TaxID=13093 RepID=UPI0025514E03|nr:S-phase kinase-associated protein 2-like isoform X1 [Hydractinia symbiolongicarpus]